MYYAVNLHVLCSKLPSVRPISNIRHSASIIEYPLTSVWVTNCTNLLVSTDKKRSSSWCAAHPHTYAQIHRSYSIYNLTVLISFTFQLQKETKGSQSHELSSHSGHTESEDRACCSWNQQIYQRRVRYNKLPKMLAQYNVILSWHSAAGWCMRLSDMYSTEQTQCWIWISTQPQTLALMKMAPAQTERGTVTVHYTHQR